MANLTQQQTKLVLAFVGGHPLAEAGCLAGYQGDQVYQAIKSTTVVGAIAMLERLHQLDHGTAMAKKREMLLGMTGAVAKLV